MPDGSNPGPLDGTGIAFPSQLGRVVEGLRQARLDWREAHPRNTEQGRRFPSRQALDRIVRELSVALFPLRFGPPELNSGNENAYIAATLEATLSQLGAQIGFELSYHAHSLRRGSEATVEEDDLGSAQTI